MHIYKIKREFGKAASNKLADAGNPTSEGAIAALESFYYAFNNSDITALKGVWLPDKLIQLNNPLGGIIRGLEPIVNLYDDVFKSNASVWVVFKNIVCYESEDVVVYAGEEIGEFMKDGQSIPLHIRTSRIFSFIEKEKRWFQVHHHGSIDNASALQQYQDTVKE